MRALLTVQVLSVILMIGCSPTETEEKWLGYYQLPEADEKFPIYLQLKIVGTVVEGNALDGNMEAAPITGSVVNGTYDLNLHPVKEGRDTRQDINYRAKRNGPSLAGEWEHSIGMKGPWAAKITDVTEPEVKPLLQLPCVTRDLRYGGPGPDPVIKPKNILSQSDFTANAQGQTEPQRDPTKGRLATCRDSEI